MRFETSCVQKDESNIIKPSVCQEETEAAPVAFLATQRLRALRSTIPLDLHFLNAIQIPTYCKYNVYIYCTHSNHLYSTCCVKSNFLQIYLIYLFIVQVAEERDGEGERGKKEGDNGEKQRGK